MNINGLVPYFVSHEEIYTKTQPNCKKSVAHAKKGNMKKVVK